MSKIFLSWSGETSHKIAQILNGCLTLALQHVKPFLSSQDIAKGDTWATEIAAQLKDARFGIICLTPDNLTAPWLLFESGAIANGIGKPYCSPLLLSVKPSDVPGPLQQFQATLFEKSDLLRLFRSVNATDADRQLPDGTLEQAFEAFWPKIEKEVHSVLSSSSASSSPKKQQITLEKIDESLQEVLLRLRSQSQIFAAERSNAIDTESTDLPAGILSRSQFVGEMNRYLKKLAEIVSRVEDEQVRNEGTGLIMSMRGKLSVLDVAVRRRKAVTPIVSDPHALKGIGLRPQD